MSTRESNLLRSMTETTWRFYVWVGILMAGLLWGLYGYLHQLQTGLIVTGLRDRVSWGLYITNFVFFIGISHAGTLISAILRVTETDWRRPITRMAEAITVFALCIGAPMVIVDLGRPDRMWNLFLYGRIQSPILWDVLSVSTYLTGCLLYFYLPLIPDLGMLAENPQVSGWRRGLYRVLALGWTGGPKQVQLLEKAVSCMAIFIIPLAVSVHTVVSWIFSMTLRPGWDSSIFGPYFVVGAIFSGCAAVTLSMAILRRVYGLEDYLAPVHFRNLGILLLSFALLYVYFNVNEYLTVIYKFAETEKGLMEQLMLGDYALPFWTVQIVGVGLPVLLLILVLGIKRYHRFVIPGVALASAQVIVGAWAKRYLIVIPTLNNPYLPSQRLPYEWTHYQPTWVEWSITVAAFCGFLLIYTLVTKVLPIVSIWETRADEEQPAMAIEKPKHWSPQWKPSPGLPGCLLAAALLLSTPRAQAAQAQAQGPRPVVLSMQWETLPVSNAPPEPGGQSATAPAVNPHTYLLLDRILPWLDPRFGGVAREAPLRRIAVTARLGDQAGAALQFQVVNFSIKTLFGRLDLGSWPTMPDGKAKLTIADHRYGNYPVTAEFQGNDQSQPARVEALVDFGPRPAPALPEAGVLITPYATAGIGLPFLFFYGGMWVVFAYAFGYLILWRMRRAATLVEVPWQPRDSGPGPNDFAEPPPISGRSAVNDAIGD